MLLGPLGIKTLDPTDWAYRGLYDNSNDSTDPSIAHGFNYHQGPEWLWVFGFFLRAYFKFHLQSDSKETLSCHIQWIQKVLMNHKWHLINFKDNPYAGLPELTNAEGHNCGGSCPTQAWSSATLIELIHDLVNGINE